MYLQRDFLIRKFSFILSLLILFTKTQDENEAANLFDKDYYYINVRGISPIQYV
jgi:hypothetical protein